MNPVIYLEAQITPKPHAHPHRQYTDIIAIVTNLSPVMAQLLWLPAEYSDASFTLNSVDKVHKDLTNETATTL